MLAGGLRGQAEPLLPAQAAFMYLCPEGEPGVGQGGKGGGFLGGGQLLPTFRARSRVLVLGRGEFTTLPLRAPALLPQPGPRSPRCLLFLLAGREGRARAVPGLCLCPGCAARG